MGDGLYIGGSVEGGNLWDTSSQASLDDLRYAGSITIGTDTILGPVYFAQGFSDGDSVLYFFIGRSF
jgi:NTE family protein